VPRTERGREGEGEARVKSVNVVFDDGVDKRWRQQADGQI
jgi:hypothetical protein